MNNGSTVTFSDICKENDDWYSSRGCCHQTVTC